MFVLTYKALIWERVLKVEIFVISIIKRVKDNIVWGRWEKYKDAQIHYRTWLLQFIKLKRSHQCKYILIIFFNMRYY